jgi:hypothetical protein
MTRTATALAWCAGPAAAYASPFVGAPPAAKPAAHATSRPAVRPASVPAAPAPDPAIVALREAHAALATGDVAAALAGFDRAALSPFHAVVANIGRAVCLTDLGRTEEGAQALARAYDSSARPGEVDYALARMSVLAGETRGGLGLLALALRVDPARAEEARRDAAFARLRDHPEFLQVVGDL